LALIITVFTHPFQYYRGDSTAITRENGT